MKKKQKNKSRFDDKQKNQEAPLGFPITRGGEEWLRRQRQIWSDDGSGAAAAAADLERRICSGGRLEAAASGGSSDRLDCARQWEEWESTEGKGEHREIRSCSSVKMKRFRV
ncbi:hypothetical protein VIGAN_01103900 [Vigna angularis var. angularis]|uniref:Uncharacterized protein n=1 Tax=Vigna angularis var. angularis TaxID=157739 RepID=A0A0S3QYX6_PHAAN|nr:hypothetical protein VIGAN_01103900 [Vigna angularis var. angularis]